VKACPVDIDIVNDAIERLRQDFMKLDRDPYRKLFDPRDWVELKGEPFLPKRVLIDNYKERLRNV